MAVTGLIAAFGLSLLLEGASPGVAGPAKEATERVMPPGRAFVAKLHEGRPFTACRDDACLREALRTCSPAHLARVSKTIEGDPLYVDTFVVRKGDACVVEVVDDNTQDKWGRGRDVSRMTCPSLEAARSEDPTTQGCTSPEVIFRPRDLLGLELWPDVEQGIVRLVNCSAKPTSFHAPVEAGALNFYWKDEEGVGWAGGSCPGGSGVSTQVVSLKPGEAWSRPCPGLRSVPREANERWILGVEASIGDIPISRELPRRGENLKSPCP